jgi:hypothetical protein
MEALAGVLSFRVSEWETMMESDQEVQLVAFEFNDEKDVVGAIRIYQKSIPPNSWICLTRRP